MDGGSDQKTDEFYNCCRSKQMPLADQTTDFPLYLRTELPCNISTLYELMNGRTDRIIHRHNLFIVIKMYHSHKIILQCCKMALSAANFFFKQSYKYIYWPSSPKLISHTFILNFTHKYIHFYLSY